MNRQWEQRNSELWASIDELPEEEFLAAMDKLVGELPAGDPVAFFERAAALDSTGHTSRAVPLYEEALKGSCRGSGADGRSSRWPARSGVWAIRRRPSSC